MIVVTSVEKIATEEHCFVGPQTEFEPIFLFVFFAVSISIWTYTSIQFMPERRQVIYGCAHCHQANYSLLSLDVSSKSFFCFTTSTPQTCSSPTCDSTGCILVQWESSMQRVRERSLRMTDWNALWNILRRYAGSSCFHESWDKATVSKSAGLIRRYVKIGKVIWLHRELQELSRLIIAIK